MTEQSPELLVAAILRDHRVRLFAVMVESAAGREMFTVIAHDKRDARKKALFAGCHPDHRDIKAVVKRLPLSVQRQKF